MFIHDIGLNIFSDPPRVKLNLGSGIDRNQISEGQDVYMDCEIRANPRFYKVEWIHNVSSISNIHEIENMSLFKYDDQQIILNQPFYFCFRLTILLNHVDFS